MRATFLGLSRATPGDRAGTLARVVDSVNSGELRREAFFVATTELHDVPGSPFAYWTGGALRRAFVGHPPLSRGVRGAYTTDDFRFYRLVWEAPPESVAYLRTDTRCGARYAAMAKGGAFARYYSDLYLLVRWCDDGAEAKAFLAAYRRAKGWGEDWSACLNGHGEYFRPGLTWSRRSQKGLAFRALPAAALFSDKGPTVFIDGDDGERLAALSGLLNSSAFTALVRTQMSFGSWEVGVIQRTPVPEMASHALSLLATPSRCAWSLKRSLDTITETSHAFLVPALLQVEGATVADRAAAWAARVAATEAELAAIQREIDDIAFRLYGIDGEDRARIEAESAPSPSPSGHPLPEGEGEDAGEAAEDSDDDEEEDDTPAADAATLATELLSWAVGVAFGRFDLDLATGRRAPPPEPGPFDPLPPRSPGMVPDDARAVEVLVDDPGHPDDLVARVTAVFAAVFGQHHEARLEEAVRLAGAADLRSWLRRSFFPFHLKRYSKSRRKAPIWWPLSTTSGSYTLWVAWPRLTRDTLYRLTSEQEPFVAAKVAQESRKLTSLKQDAGKNPTTAQAKAIGAQEDFVAELTALRDELAMIAPMWNPVHDDGVVLHAALLWRVTRDAGWQKECRERWDGLVAGKYDWAHLAMHLWPERVVPKCRSDRSLAIAHGLEGRFWVEDGGKWRLREDAEREGRRLVDRWTDPVGRALATALREDSLRNAARAGWWAELERGDRDHEPIALRLWPRRVMEACRTNRGLAAAHGFGSLYGRGFGDRVQGARGPTWQDELDKRWPATCDRLVADFGSLCASSPQAAAGDWTAFWAALDAGAFDGSAFARTVRPEEAVRRCQEDLSAARAHGVADLFWLDGRRLAAPAEELAAALRERESAALKKALRAMQEAPGPVRGRSRR